MPRVRLFVAGAAIAVAATFAAAHPPHATRLTAGPPTHLAPPASVEAGALSRAPLEGIVAPVMEGRWYAGVILHAELDRQAAAAAERARERSRQRETPQRRSGETVTGSCAAMKPAGFPDYIIARESGGNPSAQNPSGAYGCAQLMPMHLTGDYQADWARLWAGGAGACNWDPPNYCAG